MALANITNESELDIQGIRTLILAINPNVTESQLTDQVIIESALMFFRLRVCSSAEVPELLCIVGAVNSALKYEDRAPLDALIATRSAELEEMGRQLRGSTG